MTFESIVNKLESSSLYKIVEQRDTSNSKQIRLDNGAIINCFNNGNHNIQGKNVQEMRDYLNNTSPKSKNRKVFVVYGHDDIAKTQLEALLRRWDLEPIILDQQASGGQTIIEKLEEFGSDISYAIVLATPDDIGKDKNELKEKLRVRQNVVLELGLFLAKLGRERLLFC